jgi:hypothetical protein
VIVVTGSVGVTLAWCAVWSVVGWAPTAAGVLPAAFEPFDEVGFELRSLVNNLIDLARYGDDIARTAGTWLDLVIETVIARVLTRAGAPLRVGAVAVRGTRRPGGERVGHREPGEQCGEMEATSGAVHVTVAGGEFSITDEGPRDSACGPAFRVRPLVPIHAGPVHARFRASASCVRWWRRTAAWSPPNFRARRPDALHPPGHP